MKTKYAAKKALALLLAVLMGVSILTTAFPVTAQAVESEKDDEFEISPVVSALNIMPLGSAAGWTDTDMTAVVRGERSENASVLSVPAGESVYIRRGGYVNYGDGYVTDFYSVWMGDGALAHEGDVNYATACFCACPSMTGPNTGHYSGNAIQKLTEGDVTGSTLNVFKAVILTSPFGSFAKYHQNFWSVYSLEPTDEVFAMVHAILGYLYDPGSAGTPYRWSAAMKNTILGTGGLLEQIMNWANANADALNEVNVYRLKGTDSGLQDLVWMNAAETYPVYVKKVSANPTLTDGNSAYSLEGAEYTVYRDAACTNAVGTLTTGANGVTGTLNVVEGTYYAKETKAPKGYELNSAVLGPVTVNASNNPGVFNATDTPIPTSGSGKLVKQSSKPSVTDGNSYYSLADAEYTVYSDNQLTKSVGILKTDADGNSNTIELDAGTYYVKETKAPSGFEEDETVHTMVVKSGETTVLKVQDVYIPSHVMLQKVSSNIKVTEGNENYSLAGAEYTVYSDKACTSKVGTLTTKADGSTNTLTLPAGTYYAKESKAPSGFKLNTDVYSVTVKPGETGTFQANDEPEMCGVKLVKQSSEPDNTNGNENYSLAGAEYTVYSDAKCKTKVGTLTTDADGNTDTLTVPRGTYYARETKAPKGFKLDDTVLGPVTVSASNNPGVFNATDAPEKGTAKLLKQSAQPAVTDGNGNYSLAGAEYTVYSDKDCKNVIGKLITKADGSSNVLTLMLGTYYIKESKAPKGYEADSELYTITVKANETAVLTVKDEPVFGRAALMKESANPDVTTGNACYSLAGAKYGVYTDETCKDQVGYFITDAGGKTETIELPAGTYYVREQEAPAGYALDSKVYPISVKCGETAVLHVSDVPIMNSIDLLLQKIDEETKQTAPQADASLAGAEYTVRFYAGQYKTVAAAEASGEPARKWVFRTDAKGQIQYQTKTYFVSGDKLYIGMDGKTPMLPLGTVMIQETKAPEGYLMDTNVYLRNIIEDGKHVATVQTYTAPTSPEKVIHGNIQIVKHTDTGLTKIETPEEGAAFEVYLTRAGNYDKADDTLRDRLVIDKDGFAKSKDLPYGTYTVHQVEGWDGSAFIQDFQVKIDSDGKTYSYIINNERFYAFLKVVKLDSVTGKPIPVEGIGFQIFTPSGELVSFWGVDTWYSNAEGVVKVPTDLEYGKGYKAVEQNAPEGYILSTEPFTFDITPENAATEDDLLVVTLEAKNTPTQIQVLKVDPYGNPVSGAKLQIVSADGKVVDEWISNDAPHTIYKLPVGATFTLREVEAPDGYLLAESVTFTVQETTEAQTVTMENERIPTIGTTATVDGLHVARPKGEIDLIDTVHYSDVVPGRTYTVSGVLMDKSTGKAITDADGKQLAAAYTFTPEASEGDVEVIFRVDGSLLEGKTTVCYEHLFKNGKQIAVHAELEDDDQTVYFPGIGTTATVNGEHEAYMGGTITLVDVVEYKGLQPGKEYTVKGELMDKSTGEPFRDISVETLFTPTESSGAVEVTFQFDTSTLTEDIVLVAFETLYYNGKELAVHADLEDEGQTVTIYAPTLHTSATVNGEKDAVAEKMVKIIDVVTYTNLTVGKEYTLKGTLMNKATGAPFEVNGEAVTAEVKFTPENPNGEVTVSFVFDGAAIKTDTTLVVFETLYLDELELIVHADIEDSDQTVIIRNPDTPQTGDSSKIGLWLGLAGTLLGCGIACVIVYRRIRREDAGE